MNWFWKKKNKEKEKEEETNIETPTIPHVCQYKDMPWYMDIWYSSGEKKAGYSIIEPYICITGCGKRIDKVLEKVSWSGISLEERDKEFIAVRKRYKKYLKPRAVVEDMINNILLVKDPERLAMLEEMRGIPHKNVGTSAEMKQVKETEFKIILPERDNK